MVSPVCMEWQLCPKESFCGSEMVHAAANLATIKFNAGSLKLAAVLREIGCSTTVEGVHSLTSLDAIRVEKARRKHSDEEKRSRKRRRNVKKGFEEDVADEEGVVYECGAF